MDNKTVIKKFIKTKVSVYWNDTFSTVSSRTGILVSVDDSFLVLDPDKPEDFNRLVLIPRDKIIRIEGCANYE